MPQFAVRSIAARMIRLCAFVVCVTAASAAIIAEQPDAEGIRFFESRVRPVLVERCHECHTGEDAENGLHLDSLAGLLRGGTSGLAIVVGNPKESLLVRAIGHGELLQMPPKEKLPARQIADIIAWIEMGAPWPDAQPLVNKPSSDEDEWQLTEEDKTFWAFQPPVQSQPPMVRDHQWVQSPIDAFVLAQLQAAGLHPAPPADKRTLIRRATFDLIGLPPTPDEVDAFLADDSPDAFARVINRLLASPRYGERWGRHWLDVARYADSNGLDENLAFANAFRYRDYVIAAFNNDKPYDRFLHEQLAGDLLPDDGDGDAMIDRLVATGFLTLGAKMLAEDDPVKMQMDIIDEQVDTTGRVFMGLTLGCARCHDHKFDPIPTADYYSLAGIFKSTRTMENFSVVARWQERPLALPDVVAAQQQQKEKIAARQTEIDDLKTKATEALLNEARLHVGDYLLAALRRLQLAEVLTKTKVYGNDPDVKSIDGAVLIEAEEFARGNVRKDFDNYGQSIGVLVNQGQVPNFVEYDVELADGGLHQLEIRVAAESSRPCKLFVNGQLVKSDAAGQVTGTWFPDSQTWFVEGFFPLDKGANVIRLEHPQYFPHIDKLLLVPAAEDITLNTLEPLSTDYKPLPELVEQWTKYLARIASDGDHVLSVWNASVADDAGALTARGIEIRDALTGGAATDSLSVLARRYEERFARVQRAWLDARSAGGGDEINQLPDPLDEAFRQVLYDTEGPFAVPPTLENHFPAATANRLKQLAEEKQSLEKSLPQLPEAMAVSDESQPVNLRIHIRGSHLTLGREAPRQFPRIVAGEDQPPIGADSSGRLEFAHWLTSPDHPLTARVMVNRIWQGHFGAGLVRSADNFGRLGERPSHPQLLDWLALRFVESGWSIKSMHRLMMLSSAYQMSTAWNPQAAEVDPENRLLWRMSRRRLEAEAIRDAILSVSGQLDRKMGGTLLPTPNRQYVTSTANVDPVVYESSRRSIYLPVVRSALYDVFQAFDFPDPSVVNATRESTTVAPQALFMMNSKFVTEQTRAMATRLLADPTLDDEARIRTAYQLAFNRDPSEDEIASAMQYTQQYMEAVRDREPNDHLRRQLAWQSLCRALISTNEFVYVE